MSRHHWITTLDWARHTACPWPDTLTLWWTCRLGKGILPLQFHTSNIQGDYQASSIHRYDYSTCCCLRCIISKVERHLSNSTHNNSNPLIECAILHCHPVLLTYLIPDGRIGHWDWSSCFAADRYPDSGLWWGGTSCPPSVLSWGPSVSRIRPWTDSWLSSWRTRCRSVGRQTARCPSWRKIARRPKTKVCSVQRLTRDYYRVTRHLDPYIL